MLILLQDQGRAALADDKAAAALVEGQAGRVGVLGSGQGLHVDKASHAALRDGRLGPAGDDGVSIAVANGPHGLTDGVGAGGAGGHRGHGRALAVVANGDHAGSHVGDEHGDKVGGDALGATVQELVVLGGEGADAADAGAEVHGHPLRGQGTDDAALLHGLGSGSHAVLGEGIAAQDLGLVHVSTGIKVLDLGGDLGLVVGGVEQGDRADAVDPVFQVVPALVHGVAHGADDAQAGDHHSACLFHCVCSSLLGHRSRPGMGLLRKNQLKKLHGDTAVDPQHLAGDIGALGQKGHGLRHFLWLTHPPQGDG